MRRAVALLAVAGLLGGCAGVDALTRDWPGATAVRYRLAGADRARRASLERGQAQLHAGDAAAALRSLRQALWEVERIDEPWLRLGELVEVHEALADAYRGLGKTDWSAEEHARAQALAEYARRQGAPAAPDGALARAKAAYRAARFRAAAAGFGQALVELEGLASTPLRLRALEDTHCHLVLAYFALEQEARAQEEARRLAAEDGGTTACRLGAPPPVQALIRAVEASEARLGKRSAD